MEIENKKTDNFLSVFLFNLLTDIFSVGGFGVFLKTILYVHLLAGFGGV